MGGEGGEGEVGEGVEWYKCRRYSLLCITYNVYYLCVLILSFVYAKGKGDGCNIVLCRMFVL